MAQNALAVFVPSIIRGFGYAATTSQLLSVGPYVSNVHSITPVERNRDLTNHESPGCGVCSVDIPRLAFRPVQEPLPRHHFLRTSGCCRLLHARVPPGFSPLGKVRSCLLGATSSLRFFADLDDLGKWQPIGSFQPYLDSPDQNPVLTFVDSASTTAQLRLFVPVLLEPSSPLGASAASLPHGSTYQVTHPPITPAMLF